MDRFDRIYEVHQLFSGARCVVPSKQLDEALECSSATRKRIIHDMRLYLNAPIVFDREQRGYRYEFNTDGGMYELPGLWFNASELHALLAMRKLLSSVQPGPMDQQRSPIVDRIHRLLDVVHPGDDDISRPIRIVGIAHRQPGRYFQTVAGAIVQRRRLSIEYRSRRTGDTSARRVSPQRLVYYRDNWYLDAWCHLRDDLRSFAVEEITRVQTTKVKARKISDKHLTRHFANSYGIFAGPAVHTAVLRFRNPCARWVAKEQWHPGQIGHWLDADHYELRLPYGNPTELVMDILRHGAFVEVISPNALREEIVRELRAVLAVYAAGVRSEDGEQKESE